MAKEKKQEKLERSFTIGLAMPNCPRPKRANKAIFLIKRFAFKHFRVGPENVLISNKVNEFIWRFGREKVPKKISVKFVIVDGKANVFLKGEKVKEKKEKKEEKKPEKMTEEEKAALQEREKKKEEKRIAEKAAEKAAMKRGKE